MLLLGCIRNEWATKILGVLAYRLITLRPLYMSVYSPAAGLDGVHDLHVQGLQFVIFADINFEKKKAYFFF